MDSPDGSKDHSYNIDNIFTPQSMLRFKYKSSGMRIKECTNRDDCGIIIKTIKTKDSIKMVLCTDPSYFPNNLHYHNLVEAKDLHLIVEYPLHNDKEDSDQEWITLPISWFGQPVDWSRLPSRDRCVPGYRVTLAITSSQFDDECTIL